MSTYGRNFEFRVQPHGGQRAGRYINPANGSAIVLGAPVLVDTAAGADENHRLEVNLATGAGSGTPANGLGGIAVYEWAPNAFSGDDPLLTLYSDKDTIPVGEPCYVVSGSEVKVVLRNTDANDFFGQRTYPARTMVAGVGIATPTVVVGDFLCPHSSPSDTNGYWQETSTASDAWLVVTHVDNDRKEVEARFVF